MALGCTEPIAIAYAGAKARQLLGVMPEHCRVRCSGNIIKNVKGVIVPNSGGMRGIDVAATLGIVGGDPDRELAVLETVTPADIQTTQPIRVRNEPVGSTNTIITEMYQEHGVMPSPAMAGLMAAAILSDTVMFKSPTCTKRDVAMAERMARIANVSLNELGKLLFDSSFDGKSAEDLLHSDFKEFHIAEQNLGVGQITCLDSEDMLQRREEFLEAMRHDQEDHHYDMVILMLTDVLMEGTQLLYVGSDDVIRNAFSAEPKDNSLFLPKVMSRKKQIIPMLTALWG